MSIKEKKKEDNKVDNVDIKVEEKDGLFTRLAKKFMCLQCFGKVNKHRDIVISNTYRPRRWPTDQYCIVLFMLFWIGMAVVAVISLERGNPRTLILPSDKENNICGEYNAKTGRNLTGLDVLWYPFEINILEPDQSRLLDALDMGICVPTCPNMSAMDILSLGGLDSINIDFISEFSSNLIICEYDLQYLSPYERAMNVRNGTGGCYINWMPTDVINRRCFPDLTGAPNVTSVTASFIKYALQAGNAIKEGFYELQSSWLVLLFVIFCVIGVCYIFQILIQFFIKIIVYLVLFVLFFAVGLIAIYSGIIGIRKYREATATDPSDDDQLKWSYVYFAIAGAACIAELVYLCLMIFLMNRIGIAMTIIDIAAKPIQKVPWMILAPPITILLAMGIIAYWAVIAAYVQSSKIEVEISGSDLEDLMDYVNVDLNISSVTGTNTTSLITGDSLITYMQLYHLFGLFWTLAFILAMGYATVSGVVSTWYFSSDVAGDKKTGWFPVLRSLGRVIIFHVGSVLFGSLLVAIVQMIRVIVHLVEKQVKQAKGKNKLTETIFKIVKIILWICEKIIKYINKNAYILMMVHGKSFVCASSRAMFLIVTNIVQIGVVNFIGDFMLYLGQIGITICGTIITYFFIDLANSYKSLNWALYLAPTEINADGLELHHISYSIVPVAAGFVISFIIAGMFIDMYSTSIDTILLCFCEDKTSEPLYMPPELESKLGCMSRMSTSQTVKKK